MWHIIELVAIRDTALYATKLSIAQQTVLGSFLLM
jgi:hypothetical protein